MKTVPLTGKQIIYRVTLKDGCGTQRDALVACGNTLAGIFAADTVVEWLDGPEVTPTGATTC